MTIPHRLAGLFFILPWIMAFFGVRWVVMQRFPPGDLFAVVTQLDGKSPFINPFLPAERANSPGQQDGGWTGQRISGDPAYFTARVPGPYDRAKLEIEYRVNQQPLLEIGLVRDPAGKALDLQPMYSSELQDSTWIRTGMGYLKSGSSPSLFFGGETRQVAVWHATSSMPRISDSGGASTETEVSLRGAHDFYFVPMDGQLDATFTIQDVNRKEGNSSVSIRIFRGDEELKREAFDLGGSRDKGMGPEVEKRYKMTAEPDIYRVVFAAEDDVFIRSVKTTSRRWVLGPRLNLGDVVGYEAAPRPSTAWTNSRHIVAETFHTEGLQAVSLGPSQVNVARTHTNYRIDRHDSGASPVLLSAPKADVRIVGDGWFSFSREAFFEPKPKRLTDGSLLVRDDVSAVITPYLRPEEVEGEWLRSFFDFNIEGTADLRFVLAAPGIGSRLGSVDVRKITLTYSRDPLPYSSRWKLFFQELRNGLRRL